MLLCEYSRKLSAYHDGELSAEEMSLMQEHVARCVSCARELGQIRALSRLLAAAAMPEMPDSVRDRLRQTVSVTRERVVVRITERLAAAAAVMLLACTAWLWSTTSAGNPYGGPEAAWERAAVGIREDAASTTPRPDDQLARMIVDSLSVETGHDLHQN